NSTADSLVPAAFLTHLISAGVLKSTAARSMSAALTVTADGIGTSKLSRIIPTDRVMVPPRRFVGWLRDFLLLRVFPRKLRRKTIPSLFLALQARFARPGAFEVVANFYAQAAERLGFELDRVAVLKRIQAAVVGAAGEHVAGLERMDRAHPLDAARNFVRHVAGIVVLHQHAVVPQAHLKTVRILDFVGGDEIRTHGPEGRARLHLIKRISRRRQAARRAVDEIDVAENVIHRPRRRNILG